MRIAVVAGLGCLLVTSAALAVFVVIPSHTTAPPAPKADEVAAAATPAAPTTATALPAPPAAPAARAVPPVPVAPVAPVAPTAQAAPPAPAATRSAILNPPTPVAAPPKVAAPTPAPAPASARYPSAAPHCDNPNAYGTARTVEIDTTGGPGFGFEHFKQHDFLRNNEVVLTFDDGPWLGRTPAVLKALAAQCVRATFFPIGKHATYYPEILKQVAEAGHSVGSHTWSHQDLSRKTLEEAKAEIEKGISAVRMAVGGGPTAPFFRFPALRHPPEAIKYLGERNIAMFSTDMDSFDFKMRKPDQVIQAVLAKLKKHGKGIVLMHDFQQATSDGLPELLTQLKANGYKIVHMRPRDALNSLAEYDELVRKEQKNPIVSDRPTSSVVRTID